MEDVAVSGAFTEVLLEAVLTLLSVAVTVAVGFAVKWLKALGDKAGINLDAQKAALLEHHIQSFILQIEEEAASRIRAGLPKWSPGEKFSRVFEKIIDAIPGVTEEEAEELIQSNLPKLGLGAIAALQQIREAAAKGGK